MKTYYASFNGRQSGALGVTYQITTTVQGTDKENAKLRLYDRFEHISNVALTEVPSTITTQGE